MSQGDEAPASAPRWLWAVVVMALVVGGALGLVVADTRDDAAGLSDVRLVSGLVEGSSMTADESAPGNIRLSLLNLGEHEVEILGLEPAGMTVQPGDRPADPLPAPPGEWVTATQTGLIADCSLGDPGQVIRVRVRDAAGTERVVEASGLPDSLGTLGMWQTACAPPALVFPRIGVASAAVHEAATLTTELPVANDSGRPLRVIRFGSESPGLALTAPELPIEMPANDATRIPLTWGVTDCQIALGWPDVVIDYSLERDGDQSSGSYVLVGPARAELVLLVQRVCGDAR
ncbi:hypothetical protein [Jiangella mangrovi]|uniref:Uncharacterized protein n=1 Tax=Jiangella mangrovi TaxID=1524084 RepID=A0A7W9GSM4_9ACTN|nr:hypothetical protein [Jiangella mangrovi]MBB5789318.1 hypothetical protein [Jiangella mangrovi]